VRDMKFTVDLGPRHSRFADSAIRGVPPISPKIGGVQPKLDSSQNTILL
jgi:hypothetical protein